MNAEEMHQKTKEVHHGANVKRFREMQGIKQDILAEELEISQQQISKLESQEIIKDEMLDKLAKALHITVDAIKKCNDEIAVNIISNTFHEQSVAYQYNFNPIDKIITLYDEK
jgi:transcriptional regulator with XRE-family HTH domain